MVAVMMMVIYADVDEVSSLRLERVGGDDGADFPRWRLQSSRICSRTFACTVATGKKNEK
jgi:hypothetical protein